MLETSASQRTLSPERLNVNVGTQEEVFVILRIMWYGHVLLTLICNSRIPVNRERK